MALYRCVRTSALIVALCTLSITAATAAEVFDNYASTYAATAYHMADFDLAMAIDTAEAVTLPTRPTAVLARSSSVRAHNTARAVDRVARWRGLLRE